MKISKDISDVLPTVAYVEFAFRRLTRNGIKFMVFISKFNFSDPQVFSF